MQIMAVALKITQTSRILPLDVSFRLNDLKVAAHQQSEKKKKLTLAHLTWVWLSSGHISWSFRCPSLLVICDDFKPYPATQVKQRMWVKWSSHLARIFRRMTWHTSARKVWIHDPNPAEFLTLCGSLTFSFRHSFREFQIGFTRSPCIPRAGSHRIVRQ